jgi:hypothetical protein
MTIIEIVIGLKGLIINIKSLFISRNLTPFLMCKIKVFLSK